MEFALKRTRLSLGWRNLAFVFRASKKITVYVVKCWLNFHQLIHEVAYVLELPENKSQTEQNKQAKKSHCHHLYSTTCWTQFTRSHFAYYSSSESANLFRSASAFLTIKKHKNKETVKSRYMFCLFFSELLLFKDLFNNFSFPTHSIESQNHLNYRLFSHDPLLISADWTDKVNCWSHSLVPANKVRWQELPGLQ